MKANEVKSYLIRDFLSEIKIIGSSNLKQNRNKLQYFEINDSKLCDKTVSLLINFVGPFTEYKLIRRLKFGK